MAEENPERGVVVRFFKMGYGFIRPEGGSDSGKDDIFVHYSDINVDGYRTLHQGEAVEFFIEMGDVKSKAVDVVPLARRRNAAARCYNCRGIGHVARVCPSGRRGAGKGCYNCGEHGHVARDCQKVVGPVGGRGGSGRGRGGGGGNGGECYNCGEKGHYRRDCRKPQQ